MAEHLPSMPEASNSVPSMKDRGSGGDLDSSVNVGRAQIKCGGF